MSPLSLSPSQSSAMGWHNFATGQTDWRSSAPETDEEARQYIPQSPAVLGLYEIRRQRGDSVSAAMEVTLRAAAGLPEGRRET